MSADLISNLRALDKRKTAKKEYQSRHEIKVRRVKNQLERMTDLMHKQKRDQIAGATCESGIAIQNIVPSIVSKIEIEKKKQLNVSCVWFGCYNNKHKTSKHKKCRYNTCLSREEIEVKVDKAMRETYPEHYGEFEIRRYHSLYFPVSLFLFSF